LSALCVLNSNKNLNGPVSEGACCFRADVASVRWAIDGGLKEESRMYSVRGCVLVALTVRTTRNFEGEDVKECKADSRSGSIALIDAIREAIPFKLKSGSWLGSSKAQELLPHAPRGVPSSFRPEAQPCHLHPRTEYNNIPDITR
jgi:hypothetical protein